MEYTEQESSNVISMAINKFVVERASSIAKKIGEKDWVTVKGIAFLEMLLDEDTEAVCFVIPLNKVESGPDLVVIYDILESDEVCRAQVSFGDIAKDRENVYGIDVSVNIKIHNKKDLVNELAQAIKLEKDVPDALNIDPLSGKESYCTGDDLRERVNKLGAGGIDE